MPTPTEPSESATGDLKQGIVVGAAMEPGLGAYANLDSIAAIAKAVAACTACSLYAGAKNPVPGEGNPHAGFVCVGEAPGQTEDEMGKPFVGASGQLLTKILAAINFARDDVFICNVLKHRPPEQPESDARRDQSMQSLPVTPAGAAKAARDPCPRNVCGANSPADHDPDR